MARGAVEGEVTDGATRDPEDRGVAPPDGLDGVDAVEELAPFERTPVAADVPGANACDAPWVWKLSTPARPATVAPMTKG